MRTYHSLYGVGEAVSLGEAPDRFKGRVTTVFFRSRGVSYFVVWWRGMERVEEEIPEDQLEPWPSEDVQ